MSDSNKHNADHKQSDSQPIFRDEALAYISTPSDVNKVITVVGSGTWILIVTFVIGLVLALGWLFYGSIPITLQGQGILIPKGGIFKTVTSPDGFNIIKELPVKTGQIVEKDQTVAILDNPEISKTILVRTEYVNDLRKKVTEMKADAAKSVKDKEANYEQQKKLIEDSQKTKSNYLSNLEKNLAIQKGLFEKGFAKQQNILDVENQITNIKQEDLRSQEKLVQLQKDLLVDKENWSQRIRDMGMKLSDEERGLDDLKAKQETSRIIRSPLKGKVISVHHKVKDNVPTNEPLITVSQGDENQLEALIYINPLEGKEVKVGMNVYMIPTHLDKEQIGYIHGKVIDVSPYPETVRSLMSTLQNEELVKKFTESSPPIGTRVSILKTDGQSNFPLEMFKLTPGTWIFGRFILETRSPFGIMIPELKKIIGMTP